MKSEISYKTSYAIKRYSTRGNDIKEVTRNNGTKVTLNDETLSYAIRGRDQSRSIILDALEKGSPLRDSKYSSKSPPENDSKFKSFKLGEFPNLQKVESTNLSSNNDRAMNQGHNQTKLLERFTINPDEKDKTNMTGGDKRGINSQNNSAKSS